MKRINLGVRKSLLISIHIHHSNHCLTGPMGGPVGPDIPPEIDGRQMGGDVAFSFMVSITDEMDQFLCSGVLTYDTWVISAASCFVGYKSTTFVSSPFHHELLFRCKDEAIFTFRVGSNQWNIGGKEYKVQKNAQPKKIHLHPNYRIGGTPDLALIGLNEATMLDPVCVMGQPIRSYHLLQPDNQLINVPLVY